MANFIPAEAASCEIRASNSRFIAHLAPVDSVAQAKAFIASIRHAMPDASHHVYAYVIGHGATTTLGMSDDGEPSGIKMSQNIRATPLDSPRQGKT